MLCKCGTEMHETSTILNKFSRMRCRTCKKVIKRNKRLPKPKQPDIDHFRQMKGLHRLRAINEAYKRFFHELPDAVKFIDAL